MVYSPIYPVVCLSQLITSSIIIFFAAAVILKVHKGSKNKFAYALMFFTILLGIAYIGLAFTKIFRRKVELPDGTTKYLINYYANNLVFYFKMITAVQAWMFALRYWFSATVIQMSMLWVTVERIKVIGWAVGIAYLTIQTVYFLILIILFPGYLELDGSQEDWLLFESKIFYRLFQWQIIFYSGLIVLSSILTIYAIVMIFKTSKLLRFNNSTINVNLKQMLLHLTLLVVQSIFAVYYVVGFNIRIKRNKAIVTERVLDILVTEPILDMIV